MCPLQCLSSLNAYMSSVCLSVYWICLSFSYEIICACLSFLFIVFILCVRLFLFVFICLSVCLSVLGLSTFICVYLITDIFVFVCLFVKLFSSAVNIGRIREVLSRSLRLDLSPQNFSFSSRMSRQLTEWFFTNWESYRMCHGLRRNGMIIFKLLLTTFEVSNVFWGSLGNSKKNVSSLKPNHHNQSS